MQSSFNRLLNLVLSLGLFSALTVSAQIHGLPSNYTFQQVANGLPVTCDRMAADRFGNIYLTDSSNSTLSNKIARVSSSGVIDLNFVNNIGTVGQLARNPVDGLVYFTTYSPMLTVIHSTIFRIDLNGGVQQVAGINVIAKGFTIGNAGQFFFGGMGLQGQGLYAGTLSSVTGQMNLNYLGTGHGQNRVLKSLTNGSVLISDGLQVRRWSPLAPSGATALYHQAPLIGNTMVTLGSLARNPFNPLGSGAFVAQNILTTFSMSGVGSAISGSLTSSSNTPFAFEDYQLPRSGLRALTDGTQGDLYWLTDTVNLTPSFPPTPSPIGVKLYRIQNHPAQGETGSHYIQTLGIPTSAGSTLVFNVFGDTAGGDPLVLGVSIGTLPFTQTWYPTLGWFDIDPLGPNYFPIADGLGAFGPANPNALIPLGGHYTKAVSVPAGVPSGIPFSSQALIVAPNRAPNGLIVISNVVATSTP